MADEYTPGSVANLLKSGTKSTSPSNKALAALFTFPQPAQKPVEKLPKAKKGKHKCVNSPIVEGKSPSKKKMEKKLIKEGTESCSNLNHSATLEKTNRKQKQHRESQAKKDGLQTTCSDCVDPAAPSTGKKKKKKRKHNTGTEAGEGTQEVEQIKMSEKMSVSPLKSKIKNKKRKHKSGDADEALNFVDKKIKLDAQNISENTPSTDVMDKKEKKKKKKKTSESGKGTEEMADGDKENLVNNDTKNTGENKSITKKSRKRSVSDGEDNESSSQTKLRCTPEEEARTVFVGNLPISCDKKAIKKIFSACGRVETVRIRGAAPSDMSLPKKAIVCTKAFHKDSPNINAYVKFYEAKSVKKALKLNGHEVEGRHIRVDFAKGAKQYDLQRSVFVGNLPFDTEEEALRKVFQDCGNIENIRVIRDKGTRIGKGFGFVQFKDKDGVIFAVKLDGQTFMKRALRVKRCSAMTRKSAKRSGNKGKKSSRSPSGKKHQQSEKHEAVNSKSSKQDASSFQGIKAQRLQKIKKRRKFRHKLQAKKKGVKADGPPVGSTFTKTKAVRQKTSVSTGQKKKHLKFDN